MEIGCYEQVQHGAQLRPPSWNSLLAVWDTKKISKLQIYWLVWLDGLRVKCVIFDWPVERLVWHLLFLDKLCHHVTMSINVNLMCASFLWTSMLLFFLRAVRPFVRWCWGFRWGRSGPWATATVQLVGLNLVDCVDCGQLWDPSPWVTFTLCSLSQVACSSVERACSTFVCILWRISSYFFISSMD